MQEYKTFVMPKMILRSCLYLFYQIYYVSFFDLKALLHI